MCHPRGPVDEAKRTCPAFPTQSAGNAPEEREGPSDGRQINRPCLVGAPASRRTWGSRPGRCPQDDRQTSRRTNRNRSSHPQRRSRQGTTIGHRPERQSALKTTHTHCNMRGRVRSSRPSGCGARRTCPTDRPSRFRCHMFRRCLVLDPRR